ncbi:unnamed protein product [Arctia plantaginis]|uniref:Uncharacterized protein n=1 Tax=Arctia plantaginis TaxID=874455 RepID=A0A8S0YXR1_ARCPL|nr:unnamed protein product [Arctia plantaginis]
MMADGLHILPELFSRISAPARPPARAAEPAPTQPAPPRADRRPRLLLPALGVAPPGARSGPSALRPALRPAFAMRPRRGRPQNIYHMSVSMYASISMVHHILMCCVCTED